MACSQFRKFQIVDWITFELSYQVMEQMHPEQRDYCRSWDQPTIIASYWFKTHLTFCFSVCFTIFPELPLGIPNCHPFSLPPPNLNSSSFCPKFLGTRDHLARAWGHKIGYFRISLPPVWCTAALFSILSLSVCNSITCGSSPMHCWSIHGLSLLPLFPLLSLFTRDWWTAHPDGWISPFFRTPMTSC